MSDTGSFPLQRGIERCFPAWFSFDDTKDLNVDSIRVHAMTRNHILNLIESEGPGLTSHRFGPHGSCVCIHVVYEKHSHPTVLFGPAWVRIIRPDRERACVGRQRDWLRQDGDVGVGGEAGERAFVPVQTPRVTVLAGDRVDAETAGGGVEVHRFDVRSDVQIRARYCRWIRQGRVHDELDKHNRISSGLGAHFFQRCSDEKN